MQVKRITRNATWLMLAIAAAACGDDASVAGGNGLPPTAGSGLVFTNVTGNSLLVNWGAASDAETKQEDLLYRLVWAGTTDEIDGVEEVDGLQGPSVLIDGERGSLSKHVTGLESATSYAFAVVVTDGEGNQALYPPAMVTTLDDTPPTIGAVIRFDGIADTSVNVTWGAASDTSTASTKLEYKLVRAGDPAAIDTVEEANTITGTGLVADFAENLTSFTPNDLRPGAYYAFAVLVRDGAGNMALYPPAAVTTLDLNAPSVGDAIRFGEVSATSITVAWGSASDDGTATEDLQYKLVKALDPSRIDTLAEVAQITSGDDLIQDFARGPTLEVVTGLASSTAYSFAVVVRDGTGNEAIYAPASQITADITAPVAGSAISFSEVTATGLTVNWGKASDDVTVQELLAYKLVIASDAAAIDTADEVDAVTGADLLLDQAVDVTTFPVTGLPSSSTWAFAVVVRDTAGNRSLYAPSSVSTLDVSAPAVGSWIDFGTVTASSIEVRWGAASDDTTAATALEYKLVVADSLAAIDSLEEVLAIGDGPNLVFDFTADITTHVVTDLGSSTPYAFAVAVRDAAGNHALYTPALTSTRDVTAPIPGSGIAVSSVSASGMRLDWGAATDDVTSQDQLQYRVVNASSAEEIDTVEKAMAIGGAGVIQNFTANLAGLPVSGLTGGTSYSFAVIVRDAAGNQSLYEPVTQMTIDDVPPTPGAAIGFSNVAGTSLTVSWGAASDNLTQDAQLQYKLVRASNADAIDTLSEAEAITAAPDMVANYTTAMTSIAVAGLSDRTSYAFAVIVRDAAGNRALYAPETVTTLDGTAPTAGTAIRFSTLTDSGYSVSWGAAMDNATPQAALQYRLVRASDPAAIDSVSEVTAITGSDLLVDWTSNLTSTQVSGLGAGSFYHYAVAVRDDAGNVALYASNSRVLGHVFYLSTEKHSSNLGGPSGADGFCAGNRDPRAATDAEVKAVLASGSTRRACINPGCTSADENVDWVLYPDTTYYNIEGGIVGTTNGAGIFTFPLTGAMVPGGLVYTHSGLNNDWTSSSQTCNGFTNDSDNSVVLLGRPSFTSNSAIWYAYTTCENTVSLVSVYVLCVER